MTDSSQHPRVSQLRNTAERMTPASNTPISLLSNEGPDTYCRALAEDTEQTWGAEHVTPLTGGGDDPFLYWFYDEERGQRVGFIRGSYNAQEVASMSAERSTPISLKEWELHPEKFTYYIVGNPESRFGITHAREIRHWRFPWQRPRGGWWLGRIIVWWSR